MSDMDALRSSPRDLDWIPALEYAKKQKATFDTLNGDTSPERNSAEIGKIGVWAHAMLEVAMQHAGKDTSHIPNFQEIFDTLNELVESWGKTPEIKSYDPLRDRDDH